MPRINLLPIKAAQRQVSARNELFAMIGVVMVTFVGLYFWYSSVETDVVDLQRKIKAIEADIGQLTEEVKKVESLQSKEKKVQKKLRIIGRLVSNKTGPARMLDEIATIMTHETKRVWLTKLVQKEDEMTLAGGAMDHEDISEFQLALERRDRFTNVKLKKVTSDSSGGKDKVPFISWEIVCRTRDGV